MIRTSIFAVVTLAMLGLPALSAEEVIDRPRTENTVEPAAKANTKAADVPSLFTERALEEAEAPPAPSQPGANSLAELAKRTKDTAKAMFTMTARGRRKFGKQWKAEKGTVSVWFDTQRGRYRFRGVQEIDFKGQKMTYEGNILLTPRGSFDWEAAGGMTADDWSHVADEKTVPGKCILLPSMGPLIPLIDAAFGYPGMTARAVLMPVPCPLKQQDKLRWYRLTDKPGAKGESIRRMIAGHPQGHVWLGFSTDSGWPMKQALKTPDQEGVTEVTQVDLTPDLERAFEVPPKIARTVQLPAKALKKACLAATLRAIDLEEKAQRRGGARDKALLERLAADREKYKAMKADEYTLPEKIEMRAKLDGMVAVELERQSRSGPFHGIAGSRVQVPTKKMLTLTVYPLYPKQSSGLRKSSWLYVTAYRK